MIDTALITGGSRGIGYAIAKRLAREGSNLVLIGKNQMRKEELEELQSFGHSVTYYSLDSNEYKTIPIIINKALKDLGHIDLLVNNAGMAPRTRCDILDIIPEDYQMVMNVNLRGMFIYSQEVAKQMILRKEGIIINISSISSEFVSTDRAAYCISKAGVSMVTKLFARRLVNDGIKVFEIQPGIILTDMIKPAQKKYEELLQKRFLPINRLGSVDDVANVVSLLANGGLAYSTGDVIHVDGGFHIGSL
jgi:NAD(P)-dependent dehydrogenase (short-subunit alcohol dehydrogenase family)